MRSTEIDTLTFRIEGPLTDGSARWYEVTQENHPNRSRIFADDIDRLCKGTVRFITEPQKTKFGDNEVELGKSRDYTIEEIGVNLNEFQELVKQSTSIVYELKSFVNTVPDSLETLKVVIFLVPPLLSGLPWQNLEIRRQQVAERLSSISGVVPVRCLSPLDDIRLSSKISTAEKAEMSVLLAYSQGSRSSDQFLCSLEGEIDEIRGVFRRAGFQSKNVSVLDNCTKDTFIRNLQIMKPQIVHFAGHGSGPSGGSDSYIAFWGERLYLKDLCVNLEDTGLLFLNTCKSSETVLGWGALQDTYNVQWYIGNERSVNTNYARSFAMGFYSNLLISGLSRVKSFYNAVDVLFKEHGRSVIGDADIPSISFVGNRHCPA